MKPRIFSLLVALAYCWQFGFSQNACDSVTTKTYSTILPNDTTDLRNYSLTDGLAASNGEYVTIGVRIDGNLFKAYFLRLDAAGNLIATPKRLRFYDGAGEFLCLNYSDVLEKSAWQIIEIFNTDGTSAGYAIAGTVLSPAATSTASVVARLNHAGTIQWTKYNTQEPDTQISADLLQRADNGRILVLVSHIRFGIDQMYFQEFALNGTNTAQRLYKVFEATGGILEPFYPTAFTQYNNGTELQFVVTGRYEVGNQDLIGLYFLRPNLTSAFPWFFQINLDPSTAMERPIPHGIVVSGNQIVITGESRLNNGSDNTEGFLLSASLPNINGNGVAVNWAKRYWTGNDPLNFSDGHRFFDLQANNAGELFVAAASLAFSGNLQTPYLLKCSANGNFQWASNISMDYGNTGYPIANPLALDIALDGGLWMAGFATPNGNNNIRIFATKTDNAGKLNNCDCYEPYSPPIADYSPSITPFDFIASNGWDASVLSIPFENIEMGLAGGFCDQYCPDTVPEVTFILPDATVPCDAEFCLRIQVGGFANIASFQFSLNWDESLIALNGSSTSGYPGVLPAYGYFDHTATNVLTYYYPYLPSGTAPVTLPDGTEIIEICFKVLADGPLTVPIVFSNNPTTIETIDGNGQTLITNTESSLITIMDCGVSERNCGEAVMTCYSGDRTGNQPLGAVLAIWDIRDRSNISPINGDLSSSFPHTSSPNWIAQNMGEIFGVTTDPDRNIFVSATTIYPVNYFGANILNTGGEVYQIDGTTGNVSLLVRLPNTGQGLGDVCHGVAPDGTNLLFVTNWEDGFIYRINLDTYNGNPNDASNFIAFDPFGMDDGVSGYAPIGQLTWGVAYFPAENRVYFGRWMQNGGNVGAPNNCTTCGTSGVFSAGLGTNEIWSVQLTADGNFASGSIGPVYLLPQLYNISSNLISNPVSDIAFSHDGRMLLTERSMCCPNETGAHRASVRELTGGFNSWGDSGKTFFIGPELGSASSGSNSAGGIDYGYDNFDLSNPDSIPPCDSMVWATCDMGQYQTYGMAGISSTGNSSVDLNTYFMNASGTGTGLDKRMIGDVEIFKCGCPPNSSTVDCDSLSVIVEPEVGNDCCYLVDIQNLDGLQLSKLQLDLITPGLIFNTSQINVASGFAYAASNSDQTLCITNPSGIPFGFSNDVLRFCYSGVDAPNETPQILKFTWWQELNGVQMPTNCMTFDTTYCQIPSSTDPCLEVIPISVECNPDNAYEYFLTFKVSNLSSLPSFNAYTVNLDGLPPGMFFSPCTSSIPLNNISLPIPGAPLAPGAMSGNICVKIISQAPIFSLRQICANAKLIGIGSCCATEEEFCFNLESCCDPCGNITVASTAIQVDSAKCCYSLDIETSCPYPFFNKVSDTTLIFNCEPEVDYRCLEMSEIDFKCVPDSSKYRLTFTVTNFSAIPFTATNLDLIQLAPSDLLFFPSATINLPTPLANGESQTVSICLLDTDGLPGSGNLLFIPKLRFNDEDTCCYEGVPIELALPSCNSTTCACLGFGQLSFQANSGWTLPVQCNSPVPYQLECPGPSGVFEFGGNLLCSQDSCAERVEWEILNTIEFPLSSGFVFTNPDGTFNLPNIPRSLFPNPGVFHLSLRGHCGEDSCACVIYFIVPDCPTDSCCQNYQQFVQNIQNAVNVSVNNGECKATVNIGPLENCDAVQSIDWGDGNIQAGPFASGSMPMHTYSTSGAYNIVVFAYEYRPNGTICYEYFLNLPINLQCQDSCTCQGFNDLVFSVNGGWELPVACTSPLTYQLPCPDTSGTYQFHGNLLCSDTCGGSVGWAIMGVGGTVLSGTVATTGPLNHFDLPGIPYTAFPVPGNYQLVLTGNCGGSLCECVIRFTVQDCGPTCPACPNGTVQGTNLIDNGDFSLGNIWFTSDYTYVPTLGLTANSYSVRNSTTLVNGAWSCIDHTTFLPLGQFLICDGASNSSNACYRNVLTVVPGKNYVFCAFANNLLTIGQDFTDPNVEVWVNGTLLDNAVLTEAPNNWVMLTANWTATSASATIEIRSGVTNSTGNDFAVDDLSFRECAPSCTCGNFIKVFIKNKKTGLSQLLTCNGQAVGVPCPPSDRPHVVTGKLNCLDNACAARNITWSLMAPNGGTALSGSALGPYFSIPIPSTAVTQNGIYMLKIQGICGTDTCECKYNLAFEGCGPDCDCEDLKSAVGAGIFLSNVDACKKAIHSTATLTECDKVDWTIWRNTQLTPIATGSTTGNAPFVLNFPGSEKYRICMRVTRTEPDGTICKEEKCWGVKVHCSGLPSLSCEEPILSNPGFNAAATPGVLGQEGKSLGWTNNGGQPEVVTDESCADPVAMRIRGNYLINDLVGHEAVVVPAGKSLRYELCIKQESQEIPGGVLVGRISSEAQAGASCEGECEEMFRIAFCCIDVDSFAVFSGGYTPSFVTGDNLEFTLHVENDFLEDDLESRSVVLLDNICIEAEDNTVNKASEPLLGNNFSIFPNPTSGSFSLRASDHQVLGGELHIVDLWGRTVQQSKLEPGKLEHGFSIATLPAGVYFIKVSENSLPIWVEKLIKQ
ncbi:MAG: T9SS type A sorting domain-containing protein [Saprospiraceae bacterium]|nr:T9SS type A sorting domain-containing protein [Saprospiraceae bacterium]